MATLVEDTYTQPQGSSNAVNVADVATRDVNNGRIGAGAQTTQHYIRAALMSLASTLLSPSLITVATNSLSPSIDVKINSNGGNAPLLFKTCCASIDK